MISQMNVDSITTILDSMQIPYTLNQGKNKRENPIKGPANNKNFEFYQDDFSKNWILVVKKQPSEILQSSFKTAPELQLLIVENLY